MLLPMDRPRIDVKRIAIVSSVAILACGMMVWSNNSSSQASIDGLLERRMRIGEELIAEVGTQSLSLTEAHLATQEAVASTEPNRVEKYRQKIRDEKTSFDSRRSYFNEKLTVGPVRELLDGKLKSNAFGYFDLAESMMIPALEGKSTDRATQAALTSLREKYQEQRLIVDKIATMAKQETNESVKEATALSGKSTYLMTLAGLIVCVALLGRELKPLVKIYGMRRLHAQRDAGRGTHGFGPAGAAMIDPNLARAMLDSALSNVMFCDREFVIRYANPATIRTLGSLEQFLPIKASELVGKSIDIFHKRPDHQRRLLSDRNTVPEAALIQVGPETLELRVSPVLSATREHLGTMVTWEVVTKRVSMERKVVADAEREAAAAKDVQERVEKILVSVGAIEKGDFSVHIPDLGDDAVGKIGSSLNGAVQSVRSTLVGVRDVSVQLSTASLQLATVCEEISSGAQEQASSLEETASTMEQITATVRQNSNNSQVARQLSSGSRDVAEQGGDVVGRAINAMTAINQSSEKIANIITTIDEIAFQTNLLALNAAVEAARAGDQGRGFAVVASEVRNLAQRSAGAAKEIKCLIQDSVKKVEMGASLVNQSGQTLSEIVTSVKRVTDIVNEIAAASKEQSVGIEQVNKAVTQMDGVTQQNASQTEEMAATAATLSDQAGELKQLLARFVLDDSQGMRNTETGVRRTSGSDRLKHAATSRPRTAVVRAMKSNGTKRKRESTLDSLEDEDGFTEM